MKMRYQPLEGTPSCGGAAAGPFGCWDRLIGIGLLIDAEDDGAMGL